MCSRARVSLSLLLFSVATEPATNLTADDGAQGERNRGRGGAGRGAGRGPAQQARDPGPRVRPRMCRHHPAGARMDQGGSSRSEQSLPGIDRRLRAGSIDRCVHGFGVESRN